jgi:outer membrane autotransporter protein
MIADVDLANEEMDRFTANSYGEHKGTISVTGMNLISDMPEDKDMTSIMFAQVGLKDNVVDYLSSVPNDKYQNFEYYTPIYKYNVAYDNRQDAGYYVFTRGDKYYKSNDANLGEEWTAASGVGASTGTIESTGNPSDAFNPAVLSAPVSAQASAQMILSQAYIYSFRHADAYTLLPNSDRMAELNRNKYAFASTDFDGNISYDAGELLNKGIWFKPYTSFDTMSLKNGPKVHSVNYGSMVGFDTNFKELKHGWIAVGTGYLGYNGSQLRYSNTDVSTNGGLLGYTGSFYRGNFWTAVTVSAGASVGESRNMYGKDDFTTLIAGLASKTGYNFEFKEGKYIFQPSLIMSYSFIDTFDYTNAAGVKIDADPMHSVQINPNLKFIVNMKHCLHPYASVGMVWDVFNSSHVKANGITLPEMSIKPYVEYGVGIQKHWKDNYSAFGQVMLRNGGRTGVALSCGFRWAIGKDKVQKVNRPYQNVRVSSGVDAGNKKIIKQIKLI